MLGRCAFVSFSLPLYPISRVSLWVKVFNVSYERAVPFHAALGLVAIAAAVCHLVAVIAARTALIVFSTNKFGPNKVLPAAGISALTALVVSIDPFPLSEQGLNFHYNQIMLLLSFGRRLNWDIFYYCHRALGVLSVVLVFLHCCPCGDYLPSVL